LRPFIPIGSFHADPVIQRAGVLIQQAGVVNQNAKPVIQNAGVVKNIVGPEREGYDYLGILLKVAYTSGNL
jgi:hypothetical protein